MKLNGPLTRRAALKLSGGAGLAGLVGGPRPTASKTLGFVPFSEQVSGTNEHPGWRLFDRARQTMSWDSYRARADFGGFDPDLCALRSVSPAMKCWIQRERETVQDDWFATMRKALGLN